MHASSLLLAAVTLAVGAHAQLSTTVGPTTPLAQKTHICSVLDYGGAVGSADIGPAIQSAHDVHALDLSLVHEMLTAVQNCVLKNAGSTLYVPAGSYSMKTWVTLNGASKWAFRLDGFITRTGAQPRH
jgi:rhamnogalacturonan hydrolase